MPGPVNMNQVLYQTPAVEKVQQGEYLNPDQSMRQAAVEQLAEMRKNTETVTETEEAEQSRVVSEKKDDQDSKKRRGRGHGESSANGAPEDEEPDGPGTIVNVVI